MGGLRFASLGSGSRGNAMVIESHETRVLLDCGFNLRELTARLARLGLVPDDLDAIVVTHEHGDHVGGVIRCARRHQLAVFMTHGTYAAVTWPGTEMPPLSLIDSQRAFCIGDLEVQPFPVPHDAREPVQFVFSNGAHRLGVLTDTGCVTPHIIDMLAGCEALVLECNHDKEMLDNSNYPATLKQRIGGRFGHLDNQGGAALLAALKHDRLQHVIAAHLSEQNNTPQLAQAALAGALGCSTAALVVATQDQGFAWRSLA